MTSFHCNKRHEGLHMYDRTNIKKLPILGAKAPNAWKAFLTFDQAALAEGVIPKKYKELIALAGALTTQCPYCLAIYKDPARLPGPIHTELATAPFAATPLRAHT